MPGAGAYPPMGPLTGAETLVGTQDGATRNPTIQQIADFVGTNAVAGVASINGETGALTLTAASVGADPEGSASTAEANAVQAARDALDTHKLATTAHSKDQVGLGNVDNTADLAKPISLLTQAALDSLTAAVAAKLAAGPSDGVIRGVQNGELVALPEANGNTVMKVTQSEYDALTPDDAVIYVVVSDPAPSGNWLSNGDFASGITGWEQVSGTDATFTGALTVNSTSNHTIAQYAANMATAPTTGATLYVSYVVSNFTSGNITCRVRYTDGTYGNLASELPSSNGTKTGSLTLDAAKTFERFEFRITIQNGTIGLTIDDVELSDTP